MTSSSTNLTGYGTITRTLMFNGDENSYEIWETKFISYLRLQKLHKYVINRNDELLTGPVAAVDADAAAIVVAMEDDADKNAEVFASLVQFLDDKSINLIIRDAKNDGRAALKILREFYIGSTKPRIISMYCELTSLKLSPNENVTEYLIRAENYVARLKEAGEIVSESLLIAMLVKGLPDNYRSFTTIVMQQDVDKMGFPKFKSSLKNFEENEKARSEYHNDSDNVLQVNFRPNNNFNNNEKYKNNNNVSDNPSVVCFLCKKNGHKSYQCPSKVKKWCNHCKVNSHDTKICRSKPKYSSKTVRHHDRGEPDDNSFIFKVNVNPDEVTSNDKLLVDCGATAHILTDKNKFISFDKDFDRTKHTIELADSSRKNDIVCGKGKAQVNLTSNNGQCCKIILEDALFIPSYSQNILSVSKMTKKGVKVYFGPDTAELVTPTGVKFNIEQSGRLYFVNSVMSEGPRTRTLKEWHETLGHLNQKDCLSLESVVDGMKIMDKNAFKCGICAEGKMVEYRNHTADEKAKAPLDLVHSDLAGPISPSSIEGSKYAIIFTDDYSGVMFLYFLRNKSDATRATARFLADIAPYGNIKRLRTDQGTEYTCKNFQDLIIENKIHHEMSAPYSSHQNGTAERSWRTLFQMARCLLLQSELPKNLWNHALRTASYIRNRSYNKRMNCTPYELFTGNKPNLKSMHQFGSNCYAYKQEKKKLDARSELGRFIGYDYNSPAYLIYFGKNHSVRKVRCVEFFNPPDEEEELSLPIIAQKSEETNETASIDPPIMIPSIAENSTTSPESLKNIPAEQRYPKRTRKPPAFLDDYVVAPSSSDDDCNYKECSNSVDYFYKVSGIPTSYNEAVKCEESAQWHIAMKEEIDSLHDNDTYELVPRPNRPVIGGRWVYCMKNNNVYKARYVAKGFAQIPNVDYNETFSPTARMTSIRLLMNISMEENLVVHSMDVKSAYLNADLDCEVYMEQPKGFVVQNKSNNDMVLKLKKSLYGLKQSGRMWNHMLHGFLVEKGFMRSEAENCVYVNCDKGVKIIIIVWVDDLIIAGSNLKAVESVKSILTQRFKMKDFGVIKEFLGIEFVFENDCVKLHQEKYIQKILIKFQMMDCKIKKLLCDQSLVKINEADSEIFEDNRLYRSMVGSLVYLASCTRPDISYVITKLSERLEQPTKAHFNACKFVMKYLRGTMNKGLCYKKNNVSDIELIGFSDSDWGSSPDRKSYSGYCYQLSKDNSFISWKAKKQPTIALSTCEAEYIAANFALKEGLFLRQLLNDLKYPEMQINLYVDNQGAIDLSKNPVHHERSKHIDIRYHFIRQKVEDETLKLLKVASQDNYADLYTKPATKCNIQNFLIC